MVLASSPVYRREWFSIEEYVAGFALLRNTTRITFFDPVRSLATCARTVSRVSRQLHVVTTWFDWLTGFSVSFVIGQNDYFGFTTLNNSLN